MLLKHSSLISLIFCIIILCFYITKIHGKNLPNGSSIPITLKNENSGKAIDENSKNKEELHHSLLPAELALASKTEENPFTLEEILAMIVSRHLQQNETDLVEKIPEEILEITLDQIVGLLNEEQRRETSNKTEQNTSQGRNTELPQPEKVFPPLQFLEPDLGPAVLPLHVPQGYFVPFIPRNAFGVVNGVSRPPHGHASFYRHRPRGLVDVRNSPAFGFLLGGP
ncbi:UNVERIFIED_CONTAM: hypothetical protein RMT77_000089 [Armadillidium vulgare]